MARESFKATPNDRRNMVTLPASADDLPEITVIDLKSKTPGVPITIIDDTPEDDQGRRVGWDGESTADESDDDLEGSVSERTAKRLKRMKAEVESRRRLGEAAERERDAAVELARSQAVELAQLRKIAETGSTALASSMKAEREGRRDEAQRRLEQAYADGDAAAQAKATADLSLANAELVQIAARTPAPKSEQQERPPAQQQQPQQRAELKPNVAAYIAHHSGWFNKDKPKTDLAMSIHRTLMARGVSDDSAEYTQELDKGLKAVYPDHKPFNTSNGATTPERDAPRRTNGGSEGSREDGLSRPALREGQVELTRSEVSLAQKMRIPLDRYAEEKRKRLQREGNGA